MTFTINNEVYIIPKPEDLLLIQAEQLGEIIKQENIELNTDEGIFNAIANLSIKLIPHSSKIIAILAIPKNSLDLSKKNVKSLTEKIRYEMPVKEATDVMIDFFTKLAKQFPQIQPTKNATPKH